MKCVRCQRAATFSTAKNPHRRADKNHDLCDRCFRDLTQKVKSRKLAKQMPRFPSLETLLLAHGAPDAHH